MEKKPEGQGSLSFPCQAEAHAPPTPTDDPSPKEPPTHISEKPNRRALRKQARRQLEKEWLAPAGSVREKQLLEGWLKHGGPSQEERVLTLKRISKNERDLIREFMSNPAEFAKRNALFWVGAKASLLGPVVYEAAIARHAKLDDSEWLVAYCTAQSIKWEEIEELTHIKKRMVLNVIHSLQKKVGLDLDCPSEDVDPVQITRWFLGQ